MKKKRQNNTAIRNKRASFDYALSDAIIAGLVLNGRETKALRLGRGQLVGSYVTVVGDELWLINSQIHGSGSIPIGEDEVSRNRKLLVKRKEIASLIAAKQQGLTIVPTEILTKGRYIKIRIALGKGKKAYDKRQSLKKRDDNRNTQRELSRNAR